MFTSFSQEPEQAIRTQIQEATDTTLVDAYLDLGKHYFSTTGLSDSLIFYGKKALDLSLELENKARQITALKFIGTGYIISEDYLQAETNLTEAIKIAAKSNDYKSQADIHIKLGTLYQNQGRPLLAIDNLIEAATLSENVSDFNSAAMAYYGIALIYANQKQTKKQLEYIQKALKVIETKEGVSPFTKNIVYGFVSQQYIENAPKERQIIYADSAMVYANKALLIAEENGFDSRKPNSLSVLSSAYLLKKDYENALKFSNEVLIYRKFINEPTKLNVFVTLGEIYMAKNNRPLAYQYIDSLNSMKIKEESYYGSEIANFSFKVYGHFGNETLALQALKEKVQFDVTLKEEEQNEAINELETKYQTVLKDAEIRNLGQLQKIDALKIDKKESQIIWLIGIIGIILLVLMTIVFFYRQRNTANKLKILETEQRLNRARINPHFFFNAMSSLQFVSEEENSPNTSAFIARFAKILRLSLESTYEELITIEEEIDFLTQYLEVQHLRYPNKFDYKFEIDENLEINELNIPGMIIQPFVENSIEHGFNTISNTGLITIKMIDQINNLEIQIIDNGSGMRADKAQKTYPSRAMQIISDRLYLFNKQHKSSASYKIMELKSHNGFGIRLILPKMYV